ncbi:MAG: ParA family protein [Bauldia sp.]|nr:ParA family protein [Bauldia sp.]
MSGLIITVAQQKGGSGKTTVAAHLAVAFARAGKSVGILDVDPQGSLGEWFERREATLGEDEAGLSFRTASGWGARREARQLAREHDIVVVDTPPKSDLEIRPAIEMADLVLVPVQPTPVDLWATAPTLAMAAKEGVASVIVINRAVSRALLTGEIIAAAGELGHAIAEAHLGNRVAYPQSMGEGRTVQETAPGGLAAEEVAALAREVLRRAQPR